MTHKKYKKKVCVVGPSTYFLSGVSYYTIKLANAINTSYDTSVLCFRKILPRRLYPGHKHVGKNLSKLSFSKTINVFDGMDYNNPYTWFKSALFIKKQKPDVIILQWWTSSVIHMMVFIKIISVIFKCKIIIEFHEIIDPFENNIAPLRLYSSYIGKILIHNVCGYIAHSDSERHLISNRFNIDVNKIDIIQQGIDVVHTKINKQDSKDILAIKDEFIILSFGLIRDYKGIDLLIQAFNELPHDIISKSRLLIVGEIWENKTNFLNQIKTSANHNKITLIDEYVHDDMIELYFNISDIVVLPYRRASQSGIAHLSMAFCKPTIVSEVGGLKETMQGYDGTHFIRPGNVLDITTQITKLYYNNDCKISCMNRSWGSCVDKFAQLIQL